MSEGKNTTSDLESILAEHRALATLHLLDRAACYRTNERIISARLEQLGMAALPEQIRDMLDAFERRGFVRCERSDQVMVVILTQNGQEVARGLRSADAVLRPRPGEPY